MKVLLTGATGFVGSATLKRLIDQDYDPVVVTRKVHQVETSAAKIKVDSIDSDTVWRDKLAGFNIVIHCAARVHVMNEQSQNPLDEFRKVNVGGSLNLARESAAAGVSRFIFISSIKVNGEATSPGLPFSAEDKEMPVDAYGVSKLEAEEGLYDIATETGMEVVIIRPVLVYGPGVKANFHTMMRWLYKGVPLPLGAIHNKRSLVALDNLVDLIVTCISHPSAANQTFLVSDGEDLSTTELLRRIGFSLDKSVHLLPIPSWLIAFGASLLGKRALSDRLCGSLQVDISKTCRLLDWTPPVSVNEALRKTAAHFLENK